MARQKAMIMADGETPLTRTELNKQDKSRRIREASRAMFLTHGYEAATIKDIARMAEVAQGTLFLYASSKRDLLFMLYNDMLDDTVEASINAPRDGLNLSEILLQVALIHFQNFTNHLGIARLSLIHLNLYDKSAESERFSATYRKLADFLESEFDKASIDGTLSETFDRPLMAAMAFAIMVEGLKAYQRMEIPDIRQAMQNIRGQNLVMLRGLGARPDALEISHPGLACWLG